MKSLLSDQVKKMKRLYIRKSPSNIEMEKANIKTPKDLDKLKIGETYEVEQWELEPEIIEEKDVKLLIKSKQIEIPVSRSVYRKLKGKKIIFKIK